MCLARMISIIIILLFSGDAFGQKNFNNWYFGYNAGVTFNGGAPTILLDGKTWQMEGVASYSNDDGDLMFYTDGVSVWDKNHDIMPNGTGLMGHFSAAQSALIVPMPGSKAKFYIFTVTDWMENGDLRYSILDMNLNGGKGDITLSAKNIFLSTNLTEKLVSATATGCGVWVITHQRENNRFEAHLVTGTGITPPVYSDAGSVHTSVNAVGETYNSVTAVMKVSRDNRKIGLATLARIIELFDFDPATGSVTNALFIPMAAPKMGYGICFSPDNSKFYITEGAMNRAGYDIFQYELSDPAPAAIVASKVLAGRANIPYNVIGEMQIGPDGKMYFTRQDTKYLGIIPNPNLKVPACGFVNDGISLAPGVSGSGLPNEIRKSEDPIELNLGVDTTLCPGEQITLKGPAIGSYEWSTGELTEAINVNTGGKYWLAVKHGSCTYSDTIHVDFTYPTVKLGSDSTLCEGQELILGGGHGDKYVWSTGATTEQIKINSAGEYWLEIHRGSCYKSDTINVSYTMLPNVQLGRDTSLCTGQTMQLDAGTGTSYIWSTGSTQAAIQINAAGEYWVKLTDKKCSKADTIGITYRNYPELNIPADTSVCADQVVRLSAGTADNFLWWSGDTTKSIDILAAGHYWIKASNEQCATEQNFSVNFIPLPSIDIGRDTVLCDGETLDLFGGNAETYLWSTGVGVDHITVSSASKYWLKASNDFCSVYDTINVQYKSPPAQLFAANYLACKKDTVELDAGVGLKYLWSGGDTTRKLPVTQDGMYAVKVNYFKTCETEFTTVVKFENCDCELLMPSAFTPNGDGLNDLFRPARKGGCNFLSFMIYNSFGQKVFETSNLYTGWDGKVNGIKQNSGNYVWMVIAEKNGKKELFKGTVMIVQ